MLHKIIFWKVIFAFCLTTQAFAQTVKGTVSDEKTGEKLPFVSVFFNNTSIATETNLEGNYLLKNVPIGTYSLIVRMTGYKAYSQKVIIEKGSNVVLDVKLAVDEKLLDEIKITQKRDKTWENQLEVFEQQFLGNASTTHPCKIVNPWVLEFTNEKGVLTARAKDVLEINNQALGYQIRYTLNDFRFDGSQVFFSGYVEFTGLFSNDSRQKMRWENQRQEVYRGSDIHFFKSLKNKNALAEGFEFFVDKPGEDPTKRSTFFFQDQVKKLAKVSLDSAVRTAPNGTYQISIPTRIEVHFNQKEGLFSIYKDKPCQVAWLETNGQPLRFNEQGILLNPQACSVSGYLAENRVSNLLPIDYQPAALPKGTAFIHPQKQNEVQESPFFVADRPYYYSNDLIQLSGAMYYPNPAAADTLSTVVHLELVNPISRQVVVHQRLKVIEGRFATQIALKDSLTPPQTYLLRAYTQWMRNFSDSTYTYRWLPILSKNESLTSVANSTSPSNGTGVVEVSVLQDSLRIKVNQPNLLWGTLALTHTEEVNAWSSLPHFIPSLDFKLDSSKVNFRVEKRTELRGKVLNYKASKHANALLMIPKMNLSFFATIEDKGFFAFDDLPIEDNQEVVVQVMNQKGKVVTEAKTEIDSVASPKWLPKQEISWKIEALKPSQVSNFTNEGFDLQEVKVKATIAPKPISSIYKEADYVIQGKDLYENAVGMNILSAIQGRVPGLRIVETTGEDGFNKLIITMRMGASAGGLQKKTLPQPLILVDGVPFDNINLISQIPAAQVERVEVVNRAESLLGLRGYVGVISIITKHSAKDLNLTADSPQKVEKIRVKGITSSTKELVSPFVYYWNSLLPSELSAGIKAPKPKKKGRFRLSFEGITKDGSIVNDEKWIDIK
jgi:hypothetical protein